MDQNLICTIHTRLYESPSPIFLRLLPSEICWRNCSVFGRRKREEGKETERDNHFMNVTHMLLLGYLCGTANAYRRSLHERSSERHDFGDTISAPLQ